MTLRLDVAQMVEIFGREVLGFLVNRGFFGLELAERILSWRHTGFNVHNLARARTRIEACQCGPTKVKI